MGGFFSSLLKVLHLDRASFLSSLSFSPPSLSPLHLCVIGGWPERGACRSGSGPKHPFCVGSAFFVQSADQSSTADRSPGAGYLGLGILATKPWLDSINFWA